MSQAAEENVKNGDVDAALSSLQDSVRADPSDPGNRVFLFQLLAVKGQWNRALTQLNVAADLDPSNLLMAQTYRELLQCEGYRQSVFQGERAPVSFGEPSPWMGQMIQSLPLSEAGDGAGAKKLVEAAFEAVAVRTGEINGEPFEWLADADMRLGPIMEVVLEGSYYWVPFENINSIVFTPPEDLRDLVWLPAEFTWSNGGTAVGFIPSRYPGDTTLADTALAMGRKTEWIDQGDEFFVGAGQKMFTTDAADYPMLEVEKIVFNEAPAT